MKNPLHRALPAALLIALGATAPAQIPAPATPAAAPTEKNTPAEPASPKPPAAPEEKAGVNTLTDAEVDQALAAIKEKYVSAGATGDAELKRATLQGLLSRLGTGATLRAVQKETGPEESPFRFEVIDSGIGYVRLGESKPGHVAELDAALKTVGEQKLNALVLDLRATPASTDLESTAEVCRRFTPKGKVLFSLKRRDAKEQVYSSKDDPRFHGLLVVLVDNDTAGAGEIIAAVLRAQVGAMVIGQRTEGKAAEFSDVSLGKNRVLRVAVAEVTLPDNVPLFPGGVKPDLVVEVPSETTAAVLKQALDGGVAPLINESERARMNEAALVAGTNPELEAAIAAQRSRGEKSKTALRDAVLQRAVDFVTAVTIYEKNNRNRK